MIQASVGKGGKNDPADVRLVQRAINSLLSHLVPLAPLKVDGAIGPRTIGAIEHLQAKVWGAERVSGKVEPSDKNLLLLESWLRPDPSAAADAPEWFRIAQKELKVRETKAVRDRGNPRILEYIGTFPYLKNVDYKYKDGDGNLVKSGLKMAETESTPWCACFVGWCLKQAGKRIAGMNAAAERWMEYGVPLPSGGPRVGAITVVYHTPGVSTRGTTSSGWHVGFYAGGPAHAPTLLGGNQGNAVCEKSYAGWTLKAYRWPG